MFIELKKHEILSKAHQDLIQEHAQLKVSYNNLEGKYIKLQHELDQLKKLIFSSKSERFIPSIPPEQTVLPFAQQADGGTQQVTEQIITTKVKRSKQAGNYNHNGRALFPENLPRQVIQIEPDEDIQGCVCIGVEVTETLTMTPASLLVNRYERKKYARKHSEGIAIGSLPGRPIEKLMAEAEILAQITNDKYLYHIPLNRQIEKYKYLGWEMPVSTMCGWLKATSNLLSPLLDVHKCRILKCDYLMADETTIKVLDRSKKGKTHLGYYWVYYDPLGKQVFYVYEPGRKGTYPAETLKNFTGYLQSDGYAAYNQFNNQSKITLFGCMAHARRKFVESMANDKQRSEIALTKFQQLYQIEADLKACQADYVKIKQVRLEKAKPVLEELKQWLVKEISQVLPKEPIGEAIGYTLRQFEKLEGYLLDGKLQIDNNAVERCMRPVAIGRRNYLFAGSHQSAARAATFYSLLQTCKIQGIDPLKYLIYVLNNIASHPVNKLEELLPNMVNIDLLR